MAGYYATIKTENLEQLIDDFNSDPTVRIIAITHSKLEAQDVRIIAAQVFGKLHVTEWKVIVRHESP